MLEPGAGIEGVLYLSVSFSLLEIVNQSLLLRSVLVI